MFKIDSKTFDECNESETTKKDSQVSKPDIKYDYSTAEKVDVNTKTILNIQNKKKLVTFSTSVDIVYVESYKKHNKLMFVPKRYSIGCHCIMF